MCPAQPERGMSAGEHGKILVTRIAGTCAGSGKSASVKALAGVWGIRANRAQLKTPYLDRGTEILMIWAVSVTASMVIAEGPLELRMIWRTVRERRRV